MRYSFIKGAPTLDYDYGIEYLFSTILRNVRHARPVKTLHQLQSCIFWLPGYIGVIRMLDDLSGIGCHRRGRMR